MSGKGSFTVFIRITSCCVALLASGLALGQVASVVDLGANAEVHAINANGDITGCAPGSDGAIHAFIYSAGTMTDLGTLGGTASCGFALNDSAQVTGYATTADGLPHAFLDTSGAMTDLGTVDSGTWSVGTGITASGVVVGYEAIGNLGNPAQVPAIDLSPLDLFHLAEFSVTGGFFTDVFLYQNGAMALQLPPSPSLMTFNPSFFATGINDSGVVIGASASVCGILCPAGEAFTFQGGIETPINDTIDFFAAPLGINAAGVVVGYGENGHADSNGFILTDGAITYLGTGTRAYAINSGGDVVGISNAGLYNADSASATAFLYRNGIMSSLNIPGAVPIGINDAGWIIANNPTLNHAYLLRPSPVSLTTGLSFGEISIGTTSSSTTATCTACTATLTNRSATALSLGTVGISGPFAEKDNCGSSLAPSASCAIAVTFTPSVLATQLGAVTVTTGGTTYTTLLSGTGTIALTLAASSTTVDVGAPFKLTWNATSGSTCTSAGNGTDASNSQYYWPGGGEPASGNATLSEPAAGTYGFSITCVSGSASKTASVQVTVSAPVSHGGATIDLTLLGSLLAILLGRGRWGQKIRFH